MEKHLISQKQTLIEALNQINSLKSGPLVLFVVDDDGKMVGTLTDGDSRRALIAGASVNDTTEKIMHRKFNYLSLNDINNVQKMKQLHNKIDSFNHQYGIL